MLLGVHFPILARVTGPIWDEGAKCDRLQRLCAFVACGSCFSSGLPIQAEAIAGGAGFCGPENVSPLREDHATLGSRLPGMWRSADNLSDATSRNVRALVPNPGGSVAARPGMANRGRVSLIDQLLFPDRVEDQSGLSIVSASPKTYRGATRRGNE
jgi:hypothetical protein